MEKETASVSKENSKPVWLLPLIAFGIMTIIAIGGLIWISRPSTPNSNKPSVNTANSTLTATPAPPPTPFYSQTDSLENSTSVVIPTPAPKPTKIQNNPIENSVPRKPPVTPIPNKISTPVPKQSTPKPTRTKQTTSKPPNPNCIYNNSCK